MSKLAEGSPVYKLLIVAATVIWGSSFFIVKETVDVLPPSFLLAIRFSVASIILALIYLRRLRAHADLGHVTRGLALGCFLFCAYWFQTVGITDTTPGKNAFLTALYCVLVPFLFWAVDKKRPDRFNIAAAVLMVVGIGFVSLGSDFTVRFGDGMTLVGAVFYAVHIVCVAHFSRGRDIFVLTVYQFVAAALLSWVVAGITETPPLLSQVTPQLIAGVAYLAIACTAVALLFQNIGQAHVAPSVAAILLSLESVFGIIFSIIFYGEVVTLRLGLGFAIIFVAILVSETKLSFLFGPKKKREPGDVDPLVHELSAGSDTPRDA